MENTPKAYPLNIGIIYLAEHNNWQDTTEYRKLILQLEYTIEEILVSKRLVSISWDDHTPEYMAEKLKEYEWYKNRALLQKDEPFQELFIRYRQPKTSPDGHRQPFDVYEYSQDYTLQGEEMKSQGWEIIFAFALSQVNLLELDGFLVYHHVNTFENNPELMIRKVTLILREFSPLYDVNRLQSINECLQTVYKQFINGLQTVNKQSTNSNQTINKPMFVDNDHGKTENKSKNFGNISSFDITDPKAPLNKEILNINETSAFLGLAKATLYYYTCNNLIPFMKKGKRLYFKKDELLFWLSKGKIMTKKEREIELTKYLSTK